MAKFPVLDSQFSLLARRAARRPGAARGGAVARAAARAKWRVASDERRVDQCDGRVAAAAVWRAGDGKIGIAVTSIAERPITPTLILDAAKYGLTRRARIHALDAADAKPMGEFSGTALVLKPDLAPLDVRVFEVSAP